MKNYKVESHVKPIDMLLQLEDAYGVMPSEDDMSLNIDPKAPSSPKIGSVLKAWTKKLQELPQGDITAEEYEEWKASF